MFEMRANDGNLGEESVTKNDEESERSGFESIVGPEVRDHQCL